MKELRGKICLIERYRMENGERKRESSWSSKWLVLFILEVVSEQAKIKWKKVRRSNSIV